ncbi:MAG TPA: hypothetical protein VGF12_06970 [Roseateles sp.]|uniref:hypothetical protein n=1 Tax=Roseateles sp. TaxID=1971397 RepID=UPI002EDBA038
MSLGSLLDFEGFHGKQILKDIAKKPTRLLTGVDPASTKLWNKVLGTNDKPIVDQMGGATQDRYRQAEAAGIDTRTGKAMQGLAHVVAAAYAAGGLAGAGSGSGVGAGGAAEGSGGLLVDTGGMGMSQIGASSGQWTPALIESASGTTGYGASSAGAGGGVGGKLSLANMQRFMGGQSQPQAPQQRPIEEDDYEAPDIDAYLRGATVASSRSLKKPGGKGLGDAVRRGLSGEDPIDANGVEVIAIKALDKRVNEFVQRVQALAQRKGALQ